MVMLSWTAIGNNCMKFWTVTVGYDILCKNMKTASLMADQHIELYNLQWLR